MSGEAQRAIVIGHRGQDGQLLTRLLCTRGYQVLGVDRGLTEALGGLPKASDVALDQPETVREAVRALQPREIYFLAAHHGSSEAGPPPDTYREALDGATVNLTAPLHFLDAIQRFSPASRMFFASSSLVFGSNPAQQPQDESSPIAPEEPYGWQKALTSHACTQYRRRFGTFASVGILYNHESSLRAPQFLSAKLVRAAVAAKKGQAQPLVLGNLDAVVDWGYAPDFVEAFTRVLALDDSGDFVIATGEPHTVRELAAIAFGHLGLDWQAHVTTDSSLLTRKAGARVGDASKLRKATGWKPSISFEQMVRSLVDEAAR